MRAMREIVRRDGANLRVAARSFVHWLTSAAKLDAPIDEQSALLSGAAGSAHAETIEILRQLDRALVQLEGLASVTVTLSPAIRALKRSRSRLQRPLRLAIIGEFSTGKSSLANLLAGVESLPTAVVSCTRIPTLLYYAREPQVWAVHLDRSKVLLRVNRAVPEQSLFRLEVGLPSSRLRAIQILDLPGFADPRFCTSSDDLVPHNVDAVAWCTLGTQAWKETERSAWQRIPARLRGRGLLVVTHCDLLRRESDKERLLARLRSETGSSFDTIVFLSTTEALALVHEGRVGSSRAAWEASGAEAVDAALDQLLLRVRKHRNQATVQVLGRVAQHALTRLDGWDVPGVASIAR
jgi:hypothetical protein